MKLLLKRVRQMDYFANTITMAGIVGPSVTEVIADVTTLVICLEQARLLAENYLTRTKFQERPWQESRLPACRLFRANRGACNSTQQAKELEPGSVSSSVTKDILYIDTCCRKPRKKGYVYTTVNSEAGRYLPRKYYFVASQFVIE